MTRFGELIPHDNDLCDEEPCRCLCDECAIENEIDARLNEAKLAADRALQEQLDRDFPEGFIPRGILGDL